jgi:hypothetical protein
MKRIDNCDRADELLDQPPGQIHRTNNFAASTELVSFNRMSSLRRCSATIAALCLALFALSGIAQEQKKLPEPEVPMQQWLAEPDHSDFSADFKVLPPRLTYEQRDLVECRTSISGDVARGRELHIWVKVADKTGAWLPGSMHTINNASPTLTKHNEIQVVSGFYANPGQYTVAIVIFDAKSKQYVVRHLPVTIKPIENDPLAARIESASPLVEFLTDSPPSGATFQSISDRSNGNLDPLWPFARTFDTYPVNSTRPLQIDVVLNLSDAGENTEIPPSNFPPRFRARITDPRTILPPHQQNAQEHQKQYIGALFSVAQVLASIQPANGCVRLSAIDMMDMKAPMQRVDPKKIGWEKFRTYRTTEKLAEINVNALKNRKEQPAFLRDFLAGLHTPIENCGTGTEPPMHAIIFVSRSYAFPDGAHKESFHFPNSPNFHAYHYLLNIEGRSTYDDLGPYLKSAGAKSHDVYQPRDLRDAMARTLNEISKTSK